MSTKQTMVALVDDDPKLLKFLGDFLESVGHVVCSFSSAREFLEGNRLAVVDCLVTDITMPELDGFELQKAANARRPDMPVIFITGTRDIATQNRVDKLPAGRFFQKPFNSQELVAAIADAIPRSR